MDWGRGIRSGRGEDEGKMEEVPSSKHQEEEVVIESKKEEEEEIPTRSESKVPAPQGG